ncbi:MAG: PD-(D/E)XK nuclease family protein [Alphaproteobacteria bacterium]|uniref:PD-(D/E)XK nuclease family protein n=1 Tax=Candidatus Nitrobium versatile TaxID=2884831 RepID=A0A953M1N7_9BACT|nr:PD-(D/E)XK nuclease family protein [Candidatus Nitrobium versatile]
MAQSGNLFSRVRVFYLPPGSENPTRLLFREAMKSSRFPDYSNIHYIAPSPGRVEEAQRIFPALTGTRCCIPPEMGTIASYCKRLYAFFGSRRVLSRSLIPVVLSRLSGKGLGFSSLLADFIHEMKHRYPERDAESLRDVFSALFRELSLPEPVAGEVFDALGLFQGYAFFLDENRLADEDDLLNACHAYIEGGRSGPRSLRSLIVDGFHDPSVSEKNILKALIHDSDEAFLSIPLDPRCSDLSEGYRSFLKENFAIEEVFCRGTRGPAPLLYCAYSDNEEEVEGIARKIKSLYVSGAFRDLEEIVVVFPDLKEYAAMVERVFRRYGIPHTLSRRKSLGGMRPFLDLLCLLDAVQEGYPRLKFAQFLSSRFFHRLPESLGKWVPSLSLQSGIIAGRKSWLFFIAEGSETLDMSLMKEREEVERDLKWVFRKILPLEEIRNGAPFALHAEALQKVTNDLAFPGPLNDPRARKLFEALKKVIEQLFFLGELHPAPVSLSRFTEVLRHLLHTTPFEEEGEGVRIMDFSGALGLSPGYLFFGGLADGEMPRRQEMDYLLPDVLKKKMGLLHHQKYIEFQKYAFFSIIGAGRNVRLSYPAMSGNDVFLPSSFLFSGEEKKEEIPGIFSPEEYFIRKSVDPFLKHIAEIRVPASLLPRPHFLRVTDIDAYRTCPRRFFIERILKLRPPTVKEYEIEAATVGTILHKIMERLLGEPLRDAETMRKRAEEIIGEIVKEKKMDEYWKRLLKDSFIRMVPDIYEKELEIREAGYVSTQVEKAVSGEPVKGIRLKGKIDRLDTIGDGVQIIDYKTGTAGLTCSQIVNGKEDLQLFLYAAMLKEQGYTVNRVGIYSLKNVAVKWCPPQGRGKGGTKQGIEEYITVSLRLLEGAVEALTKGDFTAKPLSDQSCRNCHESTYCPNMQQ